MGRSWRGNRGDRGVRGNRGQGSGRCGSWQRDHQSSNGKNSVDTEEFRVPPGPGRWNKHSGGRRGGRGFARRFNGRNFIPRLEIDLEMLREAKKCTECNVDDALYRCPACLKKYCSVTCYKTHKAGASCAVKDLDVGCSQGNENAMETEAPDAERITKHRRKPVTTKKYMFPTKDTVSLEGLEKLNKEPLRSTMVEMFQSDNLRAKLRSLDSSEQPKQWFDQFMKDQEFSNFSSLVVDALSDELVMKLAVRRK